MTPRHRPPASNADRATPLPWIGLHPARHTFGSFMRAAGISEADQSEYLGHSRPGVTARYTHSTNTAARDADNAKRLVDYLNRVTRGDRIPDALTDADDTARERAARYGADVLAKALAYARAMVAVEEAP